MVIRYRPHHFLCTVGFQGKGYSPDFVKNFSAIKEGLADDTLITLVDETDDICAPCPHKRDKLCTKQEMISSLDQRHSEALGFTSGQTLSWGEAKNRLKKLSLDDFHRICAGCNWKELGVCEAALKALHCHPSDDSK